MRELSDVEIALDFDIHTNSFYATVRLEVNSDLAFLTRVSLDFANALKTLWILYDVELSDRALQSQNF